MSEESHKKTLIKEASKTPQILKIKKQKIEKFKIQINKKVNPLWFEGSKNEESNNDISKLNLLFGYINKNQSFDIGAHNKFI